MTPNSTGSFPRRRNAVQIPVVRNIFDLVAVAGEFPCHKACDLNKQDEFKEKKNGKTPHCAGALIFLEKREEPHQMMRIAERLGMYDHTKLNMKARVVTRPGDCRRTKYNPKKEKRNG